ncbi:MAG: exosome complex protein Rrp42 [Candidatus Micrarchaeaceae archaeon]
MKIQTITEDYIKDLLAQDTREDGRSLLDYRPISLKTKVIPNAEGSAQVTIGNTKVLAGIKIVVGSPMPDKPNEGNLITSAELLPIASEHFEMGPPSPDAIELSRVIDRGIRASGMIDTKSLFIEEEKVWDLFIDVYTLNYDGNLFDAGTLAAVAALSTCRMPKYEDKKVIREGNIGMLKVSNPVTSCTFAKIADQIILDPDSNEEEFMSSRLTIANDENLVRAMQKGVSGSFSPKEIENLIDTTFDKSKELRKLIGNLKE